jgi:hypothetical protein
MQLRLLAKESGTVDERRIRPHIDPDLPWAHAGQCSGSHGSPSRERYLATFRSVSPEAPYLAIAPALDGEDVEEFIEVLKRVTNLIGKEMPRPRIYIYESAEEMREYACVASSAVAYYDGAIHLALLPDRYEMKASLRHEYMHHSLTMSGIGKPVWYQEASAMNFASDEPYGHYQMWRDNPIDLDAMVEPVSPEATPEEVAIFNSQATEMLEFLGRLCLGKPDCPSLVKALTEDGIPPEDLFLWATFARGDELVHEGPLAFWNDYEKKGDFLPPIKEALLARAGALIKEQ